jgi:hypothetical protein
MFERLNKLLKLKKSVEARDWSRNAGLVRSGVYGVTGYNR